MTTENNISSISLQQYWLILKRRWPSAVTVFTLVLIGASLISLLTKPIYQAEAKLRFRSRSQVASLTELRETSGEPLVQDNNPLDTEIGIIRSAPTIQKTIDQMRLTDEKGNPLSRSDLLQNLNLVNEAGTDLLTVSYRDKDPELAEALVNVLIDIYLAENLQSSRAEASAARKFISEQLPAAEVRVHELELALRTFKEQYQVVSLEEEARSAVTTQADLSRRMAEIQSELASTQAAAIEFHNQLGMDVQQTSTLTALSQSAGVQEVLAELQGVETQLASERVRFQDSHPVIIALLDKQTNLQTVLHQRIAQTVGESQSVPIGAIQSGPFRDDLAEDFVRTRVQQAGLENEVIALSNIQRAYQQRIDTLPGIEQKLRELERQLNTAQTTYSLLLQRFQEAQIAENQTISNAQVIQSATLLENPVAPNRPLNLAVGLILGTLLAIITALLREAQDQSIHTVQEAKNLFGDILLGIIPLHSQSKHTLHGNDDGGKVSPDMVVYHAPASQSSEAYRMLQSNLRSLSTSQGLKSIVVTSSIPKEGKSTVSANLALALAQTGRKVLLVDADMRCPHQHQLWGIANGTGLTQILMEQSDLEAAIQTIGDLDVLTAGIPRVHPSTLLDSERMTELLHDFSRRYDFVILDTPAWNVAADVAILSQKADGVLLVARPGMIDPHSATFAKESLKQANSNVLGLVINGTTMASDPHSVDRRYYLEATSAPIPTVSSMNGGRIRV